MTEGNEVTRYDWLTLFREGLRDLCDTALKKMNDKTCRITAAGVKKKKLPPCGHHGNAPYGGTSNKRTSKSIRGGRKIKGKKNRKLF
jgi:hypothetical protein